MLFATVLLLALTRAEIVQRLRAPVVTQADGFVRVFAKCSEPMRREFQVPIARFAADTVTSLYAGLSMKPVRFESPGLLIFIGDGRTNTTEVVTRVETNDTSVVSRLTVKNPGMVSLEDFRTEIARAFFRAVRHEEISAEAAQAVIRKGDPALRIADDRAKLEDWLAGRRVDDEEGFFLLRKILEPGVASRRDVLTFASRLYLYPRTYDEKFAGGFDSLSFQDAIKFAKIDLRVRFLAFFKARELPVLAGGRGEGLEQAANEYVQFLLALAKGEKTEKELQEMLTAADEKLRKVLEKTK